MDRIEKVVFPESIMARRSEMENAVKDHIKRNMEGFKKLENDHRRLIKHCAVVQK